MLNISKERLRTLSIMVPPFVHQQAFADHATALHSISLQQEAALANAEATFEALLARAFRP
jgi:type I restriction enzyme S subunit